MIIFTDALDQSIPDVGREQTGYESVRAVSIGDDDGLSAFDQTIVSVGRLEGMRIRMRM